MSRPLERKKERFCYRSDVSDTEAMCRLKMYIKHLHNFYLFATFGSLSLSISVSLCVCFSAYFVFVIDEMCFFSISAVYKHISVSTSQHTSSPVHSLLSMRCTLFRPCPENMQHITFAQATTLNQIMCANVSLYGNSCHCFTRKCICKNSNVKSSGKMKQHTHTQTHNNS